MWDLRKLGFGEREARSIEGFILYFHVEFFFLKILMCCLVGEKVQERETVEEIFFFYKSFICLYEVFLLENLDFLFGCDMAEFDC